MRAASVVRIAPDGTILDPEPVLLSPMDRSTDPVVPGGADKWQEFAGIAGSPMGGAQVLWQERNPSNALDLHGANIAAGGPPGDVVPAGTGLPRQSRIRFATDAGRAEHMAMFLSETGTRTSILVQRIGADGQALADPVEVVRDQVIRPDIAFNGEVHLTSKCISARQGSSWTSEARARTTPGR